MVGLCIIIGGGVTANMGMVRSPLQHNHQVIIFRRLAHMRPGESVRVQLMTSKVIVLAEMRLKRLSMFLRRCATRERRSDCRHRLMGCV
jgi:hypothetical protein